MSDDILKIKILVGGKRYELTIPRRDEAKFRSAEKRINAALEKYSKNFANIDHRDLLAMSMVQIAVELAELHQNNDIDPLIETIRDIDNILDEQFAFPV